MGSPRELREKAEHYRQLATNVTDPQAVEAALELAAEYEELAAELEMHDQAAGIESASQPAAGNDDPQPETS